MFDNAFRHNSAGGSGGALALAQRVDQDGTGTLVHALNRYEENKSASTGGAVDLSARDTPGGVATLGNVSLHNLGTDAGGWSSGFEATPGDPVLVSIGERFEGNVSLDAGAVELAGWNTGHVVFADVIARANQGRSVFHVTAMHADSIGTVQVLGGEIAHNLCTEPAVVSDIAWRTEGHDVAFGTGAGANRAGDVYNCGALGAPGNWSSQTPFVCTPAP